LTSLGWVALLQGNLTEAAGHFTASLERARAIGRQRSIADALVGLGLVHLARPATAGAEIEPAAVALFGAAESLRERIGYVLPEIDRQRFDRLMTPHRQRLGEPAWQTAWAAGRQCDWTAALTDLGEPAPA
jgi:hypothetical protein